MNIEELYAERCKKPAQHADIWEHLPTLKDWAERSFVVVETGVRSGNSTTGLLKGLSRCGGVMYSYDIDTQEFFPPAIENVTWEFRKADMAGLESIPECDLLFLDDKHDEDHVYLELTRFSQFVRHFIIMHDTASDWLGGDRVRNARDRFLKQSTKWVLRTHYDNCNGLSILERIA